MHLCSSKFTLLTPRQIASGIIIAWGKTIYRHFELLAGKAAPHEFLQLLIYKAATFNDEIIKIDTVRAYHSGPVCLNFFFVLKILRLRGDIRSTSWKLTLL